MFFTQLLCHDVDGMEDGDVGVVEVRGVQRNMALDFPLLRHALLRNVGSWICFHNRERFLIPQTVREDPVKEFFRKVFAGQVDIFAKILFSM